jgi:CubicO group peptidase (beta-lactamase class C family)
VRERIADLLAEYRIPSAAVGVLRDGEVTAFAVGAADVATGRPATTGTVYQIGSMTKTWTALAFLQLVGEGRADLDEPVRDHLPGFRVADPRVTAEVTPRHLLNHTHGIEEDFGDPGGGDDVLRRMVENVAGAPQVFPLGATHGYSAALGYGILARILEVVDGKPWDALMADRLFRPLGLTSTTTRHEQVDPDRAATGHVLRSLDEGPIASPLGHLPRAYGPSGTVGSTVREVLVLAQVLLGGGAAPDGTRVVPAELVREMTASRVPVPDPYLLGAEWGLGLVVDDWSGRTVLATDGSTIGQNARLRIRPDEGAAGGAAVAVLTNGGPREGFARRVFAEVLGEAPDLPEPDPALDLDPTRYEGAYARPGTRFEVAAADGRLQLTQVLDPMQAHFTGSPERVTRPLLPVSATRFLAPTDDPLQDTRTLAVYEVDGTRYLHTNARAHPRA